MVTAAFSDAQLATEDAKEAFVWDSGFPDRKTVFWLTVLSNETPKHMSSGTLCEVQGLEKTPGAESPSGSPGMSASLFSTLPPNQNGLFYTSQALWQWPRWGSQRKPHTFILDVSDQHALGGHK